MYPHMRLVHLRYLFRIPKYVPPMRLVYLRYLFRIPKYVPLCVWFTSSKEPSYCSFKLICMRDSMLNLVFTSGTHLTTYYPNMGDPLCVGSPQVPLS